MVLAVLERSPLRVKGEKRDIFYHPLNVGGTPDRTYTSEVFKNIICPSAAEGGHLEVLQWARAKGYPWDLLTCALAAANGHLEVLQWARAHGCPWDESTCAYAAKKGHLEVFKWARARGCPCSAATERIFARLSAESQGGPR